MDRMDFALTLLRADTYNPSSLFIDFDFAAGFIA
jgi:hypothetical protein